MEQSPLPPPYTPPPAYTQPPAYSPYQQPSTVAPKLLEEAKDSVALLKSTGVTSATIYDVLMKKGIDHATAMQLIQETLPGGSIARSEGRSDMIIGGLWIAGGLVITIGSYVMVKDGGGRYLITYGPVIYGIIRFFKGVSKM
jgi:hypothetical protein